MALDADLEFGEGDQDGGDAVETGDLAGREHGLTGREADLLLGQGQEDALVRGLAAEGDQPGPDVPLVLLGLVRVGAGGGQLFRGLFTLLVQFGLGLGQFRHQLFALGLHLRRDLVALGLGLGQCLLRLLALSVQIGAEGRDPVPGRRQFLGQGGLGLGSLLVQTFQFGLSPGVGHAGLFEGGAEVLVLTPQVGEGGLLRLVPLFELGDQGLGLALLGGMVGGICLDLLLELGDQGLGVPFLGGEGGLVTLMLLLELGDEGFRLLLLGGVTGGIGFDPLLELGDQGLGLALVGAVGGQGLLKTGGGGLEVAVGGGEGGLMLLAEGGQGLALRGQGGLGGLDLDGGRAQGFLQFFVLLFGLGQGLIQGGQVVALGLQGLAGVDQFTRDGLEAVLEGLHQGRPFRLAAHQQGAVFDHFGRQVISDLEDVGLMVGGGLGGSLFQVGDLTLEALDLLTRGLEPLLEFGLRGLGLGAQTGEMGRLFLLLGLGLRLELRLGLGRLVEVAKEGGFPRLVLVDGGRQLPLEVGLLGPMLVDGGGELFLEAGMRHLGRGEGLALGADLRLVGIQSRLGVLVIPGQQGDQADGEYGQHEGPGTKGRGGLGI